MEPVYETSFALRAPDTDFCGTWRPGAVFTAMQELGEAHSARLNVGYFELRKLNLAWVLTRTLLQVDRAPQFGEKITARTWPGKARHAIYPRYYLFEDEGGIPILRASSLWVLMDIRTREMVTGDAFGLPVFSQPPLPPPVENPGGIQAISGDLLSDARKVTFCDLDINRHVNNARYVDWLCDRFPYEWHEKYRLERLTVHFAGETRPEETLETVLTTDSARFTFSGAREGHSHFVMGGSFIER